MQDLFTYPDWTDDVVVKAELCKLKEYVAIPSDSDAMLQWFREQFIYSVVHVYEASLCVIDAFIAQQALYEHKNVNAAPTNTTEVLRIIDWLSGGYQMAYAMDVHMGIDPGDMWDRHCKTQEEEEEENLLITESENYIQGVE